MKKVLAIVFTVALMLGACCWAYSAMFGSDEPTEPLSRQQLIEARVPALEAKIKTQLSEPATFQEDEVRYNDFGDSVHVAISFSAANADQIMKPHTAHALIRLDGTILKFYFE
jgi:hypothetical protein